MRIERLRSLREKKGLSQGEAAKRMGIVRTTYSNYEAGNREPDNDTIKKFADFFEVSTDYLLGNDSNAANIDQSEENELARAISRLPDEKKKLVKNMVKALLDD